MFDTVPRKRLLLKIKACGISGLVYSWIESWMIGHKQRVMLGVNQSVQRGLCHFWCATGISAGDIILFDIYQRQR